MTVVYMVDITFNLTEAGQEWVGLINEMARVIELRDPANRTERWSHAGNDYLRAVSLREAPSMAALLHELGVVADKWAQMPPSAVQLVIRNATYSPLDGLPPHLRRTRQRR